MMYKRLLNLPKSNSFLLFGARGTGKSTLLKEQLNLRSELQIDLLDPEKEGRLQARPIALAELLDQEFKPRPSREWVMIDEIQKVPALLDIVHSEIEKGRFLFALTGSSARKLKRGSANLLAGRAIFEQKTMRRST